MLNYEQIDQMRFEAWKKKIKNKDIASNIGCSTTLISLFFNHKTNMSKEKQEKLVDYVKSQPETRLMRVVIE